jgi:basic membrane protein A and related proteins
MGIVRWLESEVFVRGITKAAALVGVLAVVATGCAKPAKSTPAASAATFKACMVTDTGGIHDKSFNQSSYAGLLAAAAADSKISATYLPSTSSADYATNITTFIHDKCGIIVTVGFLMGPATEAAAKANPKQKFAIVDCSYASDCLPAPVEPNIDQLVYNTVQDGALGGYLAAGMSKTHIVATYGGEDFGTVTIYMDGFWDGVQYYDIYHHITTKVLGWSELTQKGSFINSFTDLGAAQTLTNAFIADGADIIFPVAGGDGLGSAAAVKAADASGKNVYMFWVDTDGCVSAAQYCQYFITSVTKGITPSVENAVLEAAHGTFHGGTYIGTLANGGAVLAPFHDFASKVPASLVSQLDGLKAEIESGKVTPATKSPV